MGIWDWRAGLGDNANTGHRAMLDQGAAQSQMDRDAAMAQTIQDVRGMNTPTLGQGTQSTVSLGQMAAPVTDALSQGAASVGGAFRDMGTSIASGANSLWDSMRGRINRPNPGVSLGIVPDQNPYTQPGVVSAAPQASPDMPPAGGVASPYSLGGGVPGGGVGVIPEAAAADLGSLRPGARPVPGAPEVAAASAQPSGPTESPGVSRRQTNAGSAPVGKYGDQDVFDLGMDDQRFGTAFAAARRRLGPNAVFRWKGDVYTTALAEE